MTYKKIIFMSSIMFGIAIPLVFFINEVIRNHKRSMVASPDELRLESVAIGISALLFSSILKSMILKRNTNILTSSRMNIEILIQLLPISTFAAIVLCEVGILFSVIAAFWGVNSKDIIFPILLIIIGFSSFFPRHSDWGKWIQYKQGVWTNV